MKPLSVDIRLKGKLKLLHCEGCSVQRGKGKSKKVKGKSEAETNLQVISDE
jgi:hypothetical protein